MLYQSLITIAIAVLALIAHQARRMPLGGGAFVALAMAGSGFVVASTYSANWAVGVSHPIANGIASVCAAVLMPLLFWNIKHFTNLSLPQWRSVRAFAIGIPLLLGIDAAVRGLADSRIPADIHSYVWVSYAFALFAVATCGWRFSSTPRQRRAMVLMTLPPIGITAADMAFRFFEYTTLDTSPAVWVVLLSLFALILIGSNRQSFAVRPVARSALVDQVQDGMVVLDPALRVVDYNDAANRWLNPSTKTMVGQRANQLMPERLVTALHSDRTEPLVLPWRFGQQELWIEVQFKPLIVDQQPAGHLISLRDVSRRHIAELALQAANERLEALANTDPLTGLHNRRFLLSRFEAEMDRHSRSGLTLGLLLLDLDHFKRINDQFGHPFGDAVLVAAAQCMQQTARDCDFVGRIGGEEFAVLVVDATPEGPEILARRLCAAIAELQLRTDEGVLVPVTTSIGCIRYQGGRVHADTLVKLADQALYAAKSSGRNQVATASYDPLPRATYDHPDTADARPKDSEIVS